MHDARKMVIQYDTRQVIEMPDTSDFGLQISDLLEVEYWITGKEADNHLI
jgi:hypothetical protein